MAWVLAGGAAAVLATGLLGLQLVRLGDRRADERAAAALAATSPSPLTFDPRQLEGLPDPARRFFLFAIRPGAPIRTTAILEMDGELRLGTKGRLHYLPMRGRQALRLDGFVWSVGGGRTQHVVLRLGRLR